MKYCVSACLSHPIPIMLFAEMSFPRPYKVDGQSTTPCMLGANIGYSFGQYFGQFEAILYNFSCCREE